MARPAPHDIPLHGAARRVHPAAIAVGALGALYMFLLAFKLWLPPDNPYMMTRVYDLYLKALLNGHYDLPLRELHLEGHYTPDGTGFLYHGLGPLLTRLPFVAFVSFPTTWIAPLSIWMWSVVGNVCYHRVFALALARAPFGEGPGSAPPAIAQALLSAMIWFGAPGILLTANGAIFHEPVAMAYALGGGIVLYLARMCFGEIELSRALVPLAVMAGLVVHARPHLAVGFYFGIGILIALALWRGDWPKRRRAILAGAILGLFGLALIVSNTLRFNSPAMMHGTFAKGDVQYGWVYWGGETEDSERVQGFEKYGQFNLRRVPPALMMYLAEPPPAGFMKPLREPFESAFRAAGPWVRHMRLEEPNIGLLFIWPVWLLLMPIGLTRRELRSLPGAAGMAAVTIGGVLMLSYATITLRYHVDLWPLVTFPAIFGVAPLVAWVRSSPTTVRRKSYLLSLTLFGGIWMTALTVGGARNALLEASGFWTYEFCQKLTAKKGFDARRRHELCWESYE